MRGLLGVLPVAALLPAAVSAVSGVAEDIARAREARAAAEAAHAGYYDWGDFRRGLDLLAAAEGYRLRGEYALSDWTAKRAARAFEDARRISASKTEGLRDAVAAQMDPSGQPTRPADQVSIVLRWQAQQEREALRAKVRERLDAIARSREIGRGFAVAVPAGYFDRSGALEKKGCAKLAGLAAVVRNHAGLKLEVDGFNDDAGNEDYDQSISEQRARIVSDCLVRHGVPPERIASVGFGEMALGPLSGRADPEAPGRRIEIVVTGEPLRSLDQEGP